MHNCSGSRVDRRRRLIQHQQPRPPQQDAAQRQKLLLALRQRRRTLPQAQCKHSLLELPLLPLLQLLLDLLCSSGSCDTSSGI
jgi:hypothetical protein